MDAARRSRLEGLGAGFEHLDDALGGDLAGEAAHDHLDLLLDQLFERGLVAEGVIDGEVDLLVVAAGAKAGDRLRREEAPYSPGGPSG